MVRTGVVGVFLLLHVCILPAQNREPVAMAAVSPAAYDQFIALDIAHRRELFETLDPATRTLLVRTHGERWLASNRARLSAEQAAAVQAFGDFVPQLFRGAMDRDSVNKELALTKTIRCRVGETAFAEAFAILHPPPERRRAWRDVGNSWLEWIVECFN